MTHELLDDGLDELGEVESLVGLTVPDVFTEDGDDFGIGLGVEVVSSLDENVFELLVCIISKLKGSVRVLYSQLVMIPSISSAYSP
jgi:hypothetical protein